MTLRVFIMLPLAAFALAACDPATFPTSGGGAKANAEPGAVVNNGAIIAPSPAPDVDVAPLAPVTPSAPISNPLVIEDLAIEEVSAPVIVAPRSGGGFNNVKSAIEGIGCVVDGLGTEFIIMDQTGLDEVGLAAQVAAMKETGDIVDQGSGYRLTTGACAG